MALEVTLASSSDKRVFPPLYVQTGDTSKDRLAFIHILERLKVNIQILLFINSQVDNQGLVRHRKEEDGLNTMYAVREWFSYPNIASNTPVEWLDSEPRKVCLYRRLTSY